MSRGQLFFPLLILGLFAPNVLLGSEASVLRAQIQEVLEQNKNLQAQIDEQNEVMSRLLGRVEELERASAESALAETPPAPEGSGLQEVSPSDEGSSQPPLLFIRGFGDAAFAATSSDLETGERANTFHLNEMDLLITSQISQDLSVLSELVFHFEDVEEGGFFELERLYLQYAPSDWFNIKTGRMHTPIGYWNHHFHHGSWFQTTVSRPQLHLFEDNGGILPEHSVGVEIAGSKETRPVDFLLSASVMNGRGRTLDEVQNVRDANRNKALNLHFSLEPNAVPGLNFGISTYLDRIPENPLNFARQGEMDERIWLGHLVYLKEGIEFLAEVAAIGHKESLTEREFDSHGFYVQGAYQLPKWKPYFRFDLLDFDEADPLYFPPHRVDINMTTLGVRWDPSTWLALKFEYRYAEREGNKTSHSGLFQSAFVF